MTDRMSAALTAISLIERPHDDDLNALLPTDLGEALRVLSSTVWCAHALGSQLALHLGVDRDAILTELRNSITDAFKADPDDETGHDK